MVFIRKTKRLENTNKEARAVNVLQWFQEDASGTVWFTHLNIYMNKYPNNLKLSVLQYKHYTGDSLKVIRGLNDIQKKVCAPNDRGSH